MIPANHSIKLIDLLDDININNVLNSYIIYDENYRKILNNKILDHYSFEEIGFESPAMFAHYLKVRLQEIMPKYNKLYESELLKIDPLINYSIKEKMDRKNEGKATSLSQSSNNTNSSSSQDNEQNHVFQNTPQGNLAYEDINNYSYATTHDMEKNSESINGKKESTSKVNDSTDTNSTENYIKTLTGNNNISSTKLYLEYVNNFIHIDKLIIDELEDLFMLVY